MSRTVLVLVALSILLVSLAIMPDAGFPAVDLGPRTGTVGAGGYIDGLTPGQITLFAAGLADFAEADGLGEGLGPRFNLDSCGGCHLQPAVCGTSPAVNPQVAVATAFSAQNVVPSFVTVNGPVREVRFQRNPDGSRDGGVHSLFVISGRVDDGGNASECGITQDDFDYQFQRNNAIFRIPTPVFGAGLIEAIPDAAIVANQAANASQKAALGIAGRPHFLRPDIGSPNKNGNDGTIARFGWKAQNKSLLLFSGEAYNVEIGITNELFNTERDETEKCQLVSVPNSVVNPNGITAADALSAIEKFAFFMRTLAPPIPSPDTPGGPTSIANGRALFTQVGCALCHTPTFTTGNATITALAGQAANLYSDLLLHHMGAELADDIIQGQAGPDEFRTAPMWGLGQRLFFLHDGRTANLIEAIQAHQSKPQGGFKASEANAVVDNFNQLGESQKQDLLNFLRSL